MSELDTRDKYIETLEKEVTLLRAQLQRKSAPDPKPKALLIPLPSKPAGNPFAPEMNVPAVIKAVFGAFLFVAPGLLFAASYHAEGAFAKEEKQVAAVRPHLAEGADHLKDIPTQHTLPVAVRPPIKKPGVVNTRTWFGEIMEG